MVWILFKFILSMYYLSSKSFLHYDIKENNIGFTNNK